MRGRSLFSFRVIFEHLVLFLFYILLFYRSKKKKKKFENSILHATLILLTSSSFQKPIIEVLEPRITCHEKSLFPNILNSN